jgi:hypothetical protein
MKRLHANGGTAAHCPDKMAILQREVIARDYMSIDPFETIGLPWMQRGRTGKIGREKSAR